jgi:hypothetical protein
LLWNKAITVPLTGKNYTWSIANIDYISKTFQLMAKETSEIWTYNLETGALLWGPTKSFNPFDFYGFGATVKYGQLITTSQYGGYLAGYDIATGKLNWVYNATGVGYESAYGANMPLSVGAIVDGCAICYSGEHSPTKPLWRESDVRCVNLTDGTLVWKLLDFNLGLGVADGCIVTASQYDNAIYCIGKGPSATTVSIQNDVITQGKSVLVKGMVTDKSPGTTQLAQTARFPNGVPAIADKYMEAWMENLYMQQIKPADATGVEVVLNVLDPNGNYYEVGRTTSDASGMFSCAFTPEVPGKYTVIATFAGSNSYWPSIAETALNVEAAPETTTAPTQAPQSMADMYFVPAIVGLSILVIVVLVLVLLLILRKRP